MPQPGLVAGQQQRLGVQLVDRVRDLADFLGGVHRQRLGRRFVTGPHPGDLALEILVGDLQSAVPQHPQRLDQRARHQQHDDERGDDGGQHQHGVADRGVAPIVGLVLDGLRHQRGGVLDDLRGDPVGGLHRVQQRRVVDQQAGRIGHHRPSGSPSAAAASWLPVSRRRAPRPCRTTSTARYRPG